MNAAKEKQEKMELKHIFKDKSKLKTAKKTENSE